MIEIKKRTAPRELAQLEKRLIKRGLTAKQEYDILNGNTQLKRQVRESLMKEQGHICAYCMRKIPDERPVIGSIPRVRIEHWIARNQKGHEEDKGTGLGVAYSNLLAVCSGGEVPRGTKRGNQTTCDVRRGNTAIKVDPLNPSTLSTIYYKNNGQIAATDPEINKDLTETLNLNCIKYSNLPEGRKKVLEPIQEEIYLLESEEKRKNRCKELLDMYEEEGAPKTPYCGIIIWWLKNYIN